MASLEVKEAVKLAKNYIADIYDGEDITDIGLEEVKCEDSLWRVTIGFFRPWERQGNKLFASPSQRTYKVVHISDGSTYGPKVTAVSNLEAPS